MTTGALRKTATGWFFTLQKPLPAGEVLNVAVEIATLRGVTPDGTRFTAGVVASGSEVAPVPADPLEFTVKAAPVHDFADTTVQGFIGTVLRPSFLLVNRRSSVDGALGSSSSAPMPGACLAR